MVYSRAASFSHYPPSPSQKYFARFLILFLLFSRGHCISLLNFHHSCDIHLPLHNLNLTDMERAKPLFYAHASDQDNSRHARKLLYRSRDKAQTKKNDFEHGPMPELEADRIRKEAKIIAMGVRKNLTFAWI